MEPIYFVTSNARKVEDFLLRSAAHNIPVEPLEYDIEEVQYLDVVEVAKAKLETAITTYPDRKLLVDDRGFFISALNDFPGAYIKPFLKSLSPDDILRLLEGKEDRQARFITVLGYYDGKQRHFFVEEENGFILEQSQGDNLRGWTDLLYIYGHHSIPGKSLAEYTDSEWNQYLEILKDNDCVHQLAQHLQLHHEG